MENENKVQNEQSTSWRIRDRHSSGMSNQCSCLQLTYHSLAMLAAVGKSEMDWMRCDAIRFTIEKCEAKGIAVTVDGAVWFVSTRFD